MAIKREIVIEVDDQGAIKSIDGLTDALNDNTTATENATDANEAFEESIKKQQAQMQVLDGAVNLVGGSIETLAGGLVLSGALSDDQAEAFEGAAVGALAFADGTRRTIDGIVNLREGLKVLTKGQKLATLATKAFGIAQKIAMGPVGLAIAAFGIITAAVILLKDKFEPLNKAIQFFSGLISQAAQAIGLGKSEADKFAESQGKLAESTSRQLELLKAQGADTETLIKKERELLTQRKNAAKTDEERIDAAQALAVFEATVLRQKQEAEAKAAAEEKARREQAYKERKALREKEAAEKKAAEDKAEEERLAKIEEEKQAAIDAEEDRLQSLADIQEEFKRKKEDEEAADEAAKLELEKQRQLAELEALKASEEEKQQVIDFYNDRIVEANEAANAQMVADNQATKDANDAIAQQEAAAKEAAINGSVDAIQDAIGGLFGESKAVAKANVLIDSAQAGIGIIKSSTSIPQPFGAIFAAAQIAALAVSTRSALQEINSAQPGSGGGGGGSTPGPTTVPNGSSAGSISSTVAPQLTSSTEPIKAYVLSGDVTSGQQADNRLNQRRTL